MGRTSRPPVICGVGLTDRPEYPWRSEGFLVQDLFVSDWRENPLYADRQLVVTRATRPIGLRFAGEIDITNSSAVADTLKVFFNGHGDHHLDVSGLSFCDVSGIRALVDIAIELGEGRKLLLHGLPNQLQAVLRVTGWSSLPNLAICSCGGDGL